MVWVENELEDRLEAVGHRRQGLADGFRQHCDRTRKGVRRHTEYAGGVSEGVGVSFPHWP